MTGQSKPSTGNKYAASRLKTLQWRFQRGVEFFKRQDLPEKEIVGNERR